MIGILRAATQLRPARRLVRKMGPLIPISSAQAGRETWFPGGILICCVMWSGCTLMISISLDQTLRDVWTDGDEASMAIWSLRKPILL